jgi:hypothetical protein
LVRGLRRRAILLRRLRLVLRRWRGGLVLVRRLVRARRGLRATAAAGRSFLRGECG